MGLAAHAEIVIATDVERRCEDRVLAEGSLVAAEGLFGDLLEADALDLGRGAGEILLHEIGSQPDGIEYLGAAIGLVGRDAHLGHHLEDALVDRLDVALEQLLAADVLAKLAEAAPRASRRPR